MKVIALTIAEWCSKLSPKRLFGSVFLQTQPLPPSFHLTHFELLYDRLDSSALAEMSSRIQLYYLLQLPVKVGPLTEQIPPEYIGRVSRWNGEKLESQMYLKILVEYVEKKTIVDLPISPL